MTQFYGELEFGIVLLIIYVCIYFYAICILFMYYVVRITHDAWEYV